MTISIIIFGLITSVIGFESSVYFQTKLQLLQINNYRINPNLTEQFAEIVLSDFERTNIVEKVYYTTGDVRYETNN